MADYRILLGVKVNTLDIRDQINKSLGNQTQFKKIKLEINKRHIDSQIASIRKQIQNLSNIKINLNINAGMSTGTASGAVNGANKTVSELTTAYNKLKNISKNIGEIKFKLSDGLDTSRDVQQIKVLEAQLQSLTSEYHKTVSKIKSGGDLSPTQWQSVQQQIDNTKIKLEQLEAELADAKNKLATGIKLNFGNYDAQVASLETKFGKLSNRSVGLRKGIDAVKQALAVLKSADSTEALIAANENYKRVLKEVKAQLDLNASAERQANNNTALIQSKQNLSLKMSNWLKDNSSAAKQFGADIKNLQIQLNRCNSQADVSRVSKAFTNITLKAKEAGVATQTFGDQLKAQFAKYKTYFSVATIFMYAVQGLKDMFNQVVAIDTAMTELKKVTDETDASYNQFLSNAASRAKEIGTTIDGLVTSTADFARLGYGFKDAQGLAEVANIYTVVGDEIDGVDTATQSLISTMAAFKDEMNGLSDSDFALGIVDKFNEVSNNFAISSGGIGEALTRSASSMAAANNTLDETIALITAAM